MLTFTPQADLSLLCAYCFYHTRTSRSQRSFVFCVDLCPIVHGPLSFAREPFSFTSGLFFSDHFGFACGPFSTSQVNRFLSQKDLCISLEDLFVQAGLFPQYAVLLPSYTDRIHSPGPSGLFHATNFSRADFPPQKRTFSVARASRANRVMLQETNSSHC